MDKKMKPVTIYTTPICGYCHRAKKLLNKKGIKFTEINVMLDPSRRAEMMKRSNGGRTVPQIFFGDDHIGGCDDLFELEFDGEIEARLAN